MNIKLRKREPAYTLIREDTWEPNPKWDRSQIVLDWIEQAHTAEGAPNDPVMVERAIKALNLFISDSTSIIEEELAKPLKAPRGSSLYGDELRDSERIRRLRGSNSSIAAYIKDIRQKASAPHVASRYAASEKSRVKLPMLEGYKYSLDACFGEREDEPALEWFSAACETPEGAPHDPTLAAHVARLLREERGEMENVIALELKKPLRSVVDSYHERDVELINDNKKFIKSFDVWLRKLATAS